MCAAIIIALAACALPASAAQQVTADIPVEIEGGGTALVTSEVNCPLPKKTVIEVPNGMTEQINISFNEPGLYTYIINTADKDGVFYDPEYYTARIAVNVADDESLSAVTVLTKANTDLKPDSCKFAVVAEPPTQEPTAEHPTEPSGDSPTAPSAPAATVPDQPDDGSSSRPQTGDNSRLDFYLLLSIVAAAGLFVLSVGYTASTNKLIRRG